MLTDLLHTPPANRLMTVAAVTAFLLCLPPFARLVAAQPAEPISRPADPVAENARRVHEENLARYRNSPDFLVRPGVLADRKNKVVRLWARSTGIPAPDPLEFLIIPTDSGKDYEALAVAFARPSDVHAALEFIGMKGGRPVNYMKDQYWPKGERVIIHVEWPQQPVADGRLGDRKNRVRAEDMILNIRNDKTLPHSGFVFTDSFWITPEGGGKPIYAADETDSKSIVADYNDRSTVLDVPRQAPQSSVYGFQKLNPKCVIPAQQPVEFTLEPEHKDGKLRVRDLSLLVSLPAGGANPQAGKYVLKDASGKQVGADDSLLQLLASFGEMTEAGQDPFVTVHVDDSMGLAAVAGVYAMLMKMDNENGIRIEPAPEGHLYYRAFFPSDEWRDRNKRLGRPWELHLVEKDHKLAGTLILPADDIENNEGKGDLKWTVGSAGDMAKILVEKSNKFSSIIYIFPPASLKYGELMSFIRPSMKTHAAYVFMPKE